jgi:acetyltransferase-like isoleucine patch superfamily enzyme
VAAIAGAASMVAGNQSPKIIQRTVTEAFLVNLEYFRIFQRRNNYSDAGKQIQYRRRLKIGDVVTFRSDCTIEEHTTFAEGKTFVRAGSFCDIVSELLPGSIVGRYASIASGVKFLGTRHPVEAVMMSAAGYDLHREYLQTYAARVGDVYGELFEFSRVKTPQPQKQPITIGNDAWIGGDVLLSGGITIGDGAVVAARSVVTKNVPPYAIVGGNPAKLIRYRFDEDLCDLLMLSRWWDYELVDLHKLPLGDPRAFCDRFFELKSKIRLYNPRQVKVLDLFDKPHMSYEEGKIDGPSELALPPKAEPPASEFSKINQLQTG